MAWGQGIKRRDKEGQAIGLEWHHGQFMVQHYRKVVKMDVPVDWQDTQVLHAQIGDYVTIARQDRNSDDWYLGSITDENGRTLETPLDFLGAERPYVAEIYADGPDADWESNPLSIDTDAALVDQDTTLTLRLAPGGGQAVRLRPATEADVQRIPPYQP